MKNNLKVVFLASELTPIAKVGGLGDVVGALPKALYELGINVSVFLPFYGCIDVKKYKIRKIKDGIKVVADSRIEKIGLWRTSLPDSKISAYLISHKYFSGKEIYYAGAKMANGKYEDSASDINRFVFFTKAALTALRVLKLRPDIIHCHDWHTALAPDLLKTENEKNDFFKKTKTVYTIHNLANQGIAAPVIIGFSGLDQNLPVIKADLENGDINMMVQGIMSADIINTVSPSYAQEILSHYKGAGLDQILLKRKNDLYGVVNGIDTDFYNPQTDKFIKSKYSIVNLNKKADNKIVLQKKLGLPIDKKIALIGLVSRLVWQKGIELVTDEFLKLNCQFVFLGTGDKKLEEGLKKLAEKYPDKFRAIIKFDEELSHLIYAGSDIFLMPSLFEPCGLGQMIAMRYGAVPVVRATGGLKDTVRQLSIKKADGFVFRKFESEALFAELKKALDIYYEKPKFWKQLMINGMKADFSWEKSAKEYLKIYKMALKK